MLAFKLPQITQAEKQGEQTEPKSLCPRWVSDKGQRALFGRRCDAFHRAVAPHPKEHSPGGTKDFADWGGEGKRVGQLKVGPPLGGGNLGNTWARNDQFQPGAQP